MPLERVEAVLEENRTLTEQAERVAEIIQAHGRALVGGMDAEAEAEAEALVSSILAGGMEVEPAAPATSPVQHVQAGLAQAPTQLPEVPTSPIAALLPEVPTHTIILGPVEDARPPSQRVAVAE